MMKVNEHAVLLLKDGTESSGTIKKITDTYIIIDDDGSFGGYLKINVSDIENAN